MKAFNLVGKRFGKLVVLSQIEKDKFKKIRWSCVCDCGNTHIASTDILCRGATKSCGCYRNTFKLLPSGEASFNQYLCQYRNNARVRKVDFFLSEEEFKSIIGKSCEYCGAEPKSYFSRNRKVAETTAYLCNGIDRVDNRIGYTFRNCVPCCSLCNYMKRGLTQSDFIKHVQKISSYPKVN